MKLMLIVRVILMITFTQSFNAWAEEARPLQTDVVTEAQVHRLSQELRCLVCQNQTLADSHAELAQDLMQEIRERIKLLLITSWHVMATLCAIAHP